MVDLYFTFLGPYATAVVDFYRAHQNIFNLVVLFYGVVLAVAHRNLGIVERLLQEETGQSDMRRLGEHLHKNPLSDELVERIKSRLWLPILASPWHFTFYRFSGANVVRILDKKYARSRRT